jgi:glucokinase
MGNTLGIDIGGTKVAFGLLDESGKLVRKQEIKTPESLTASLFVDALCEATKEFLSGEVPDGCGIGIPGAVDRAHGMVLDTPNIPHLKGLMLGQALSEAIGCKCWLDNDANLAGLAEFDALDPRLVRNLIYMTVSTGIGGAVIIGGNLFYGDNGFSGEFGHSLATPGQGMPCACNNLGCFESYAGGAHIDEWVRALAHQYPQSSLVELSKTRAVAGPDLIKAIEAGDKLADLLYKRMTKMIGLLCYNIYQGFGINTYVFGGGLMTHSDLIFDGVVEQFNKFNRRGVGGPTFLRAQLGGDSGVIGAAALARRKVMMQF